MSGGVAGGMRRRPALPAYTPTSLPGAELDERTVGRKDVIVRLVGFLRTAATSRDRPHVLVVGPRGSGKTHLLAVVLHRVRQDDDVARRLAFAWLPEDAVGISSYEDLLVVVVESLLDGAPGAAADTQAALDDARRHRAARDSLALERLVRRLCDGRVLVLVLENLDRVFGLLGEPGQARLRAFMETTGELLLLASTPLLFDAVSKRAWPWFGSFAVEHLGELSVGDGGLLLERVARESGDDELARFLETDEGRGRLRAVAHLAGGSPRMWMILAGCMTIELVDELVPLVEAMLDQLAPYYQQRLLELPPTEQKLVAELCRTALGDRGGRLVHEQRGMRTVADLAAVCGIDQRVAATALGRLRDARWVRRTKPAGTDRRTTWYEVREPLLRHCLQFRETRGEPLHAIVGFLRAWYAPVQAHRRRAAAQPRSPAERHLLGTIADERVSALGEEHPDALTSRSNLAGFSGAVGDHAATRDRDRDRDAELIRDRSRTGVIASALAAGRAAELNAAILRATPRFDDASIVPWLSEWLEATRQRDELAVAHRLLRAVDAARADDPAPALALAPEEREVVAEVVAECSSQSSRRASG